jgi:VWFA-related protein
MPHRSVAAVALAAWLVAPPLHADPGEKADADPLDIGLEERVKLRLVLVDMLVLDARDRPVPGLGKDDFEIVVDGERRALDTLDVDCSEGALEEPVAVRTPTARPVVSSDVVRRIVFALDYLHLDRLRRTEVLERLRKFVPHGLSAQDEVMVVALNGGLRVEQPFTHDHVRVAEVLKRMQYDITLWQPAFSHANEQSFFRGLSALVGVLEHVPGGKAIVLYSNSHVGLQDDNDLAFAKLAAGMAISRCSIYPVHAAGLEADPAPG